MQAVPTIPVPYDATPGETSEVRSRATMLQTRLVYGLLFLACLLLDASALLPRFYQINPWDEAFSINSGRLLLQGTLPTFASNPLVSVFYALLYVPLHTLPSWFLLGGWIARLVLFCLIWMVAFLVARQIRDLIHPVVPLSLLLVTAALPALLANTSDALFATTSGLTLCAVLSFYGTKRRSRLALASALLGLAALSRNDGLVLFPIFLLLVAAVQFVRSKGSGWRRLVRDLASSLVLCTVPFVLLVGGYYLLYGARTGDYHLDTKARSYAAFEQGQGAAYSTGTDFTGAITYGVLQARQLYGTPEENHYSIPRAIAHNPRAFAQREVRIVGQGAEMAILSYGWPFGLLIWPLVIGGCIHLFRRGKGLLVLTCVCWIAPLGVYLLTFFRGYFVLPYAAVMVLTSFGFAATIARLSRSRWLWAALAMPTVLAAFLLAGELSGQGGLVAGVILAVAIGVTWAVAAGKLPPRASAIALAIGLVALLPGLIASERTGPRLGATGEEQASQYLQAHFAPNTTIAAYMPEAVLAAKMSFAPLIFDVHSMNSQQDLSAWLCQTKVRAIYLDYWLPLEDPHAYALIQGALGQLLTVGFQVTDPDNRRQQYMQAAFGRPIPETFTVLLVKEPSGQGTTSHCPQ